MKITVNPKKRGNPTWLPATKESSILIAARVPVPLANAIAASGLTKTDAIILALTEFFSAKK